MAHRKKGNRGPIADPPFEHHTQAEQISPSAAQESIAKYLSRSESRPYMHPDSFLASTGIRFAIGTGPKGGVALHHLRRIEAGLRGEYLEKETPEQLEALFGDQWRAAGDDYMLDSHIVDSEERLRKEKKRRKRKREEIEDWVSSSSSTPLADQIIEEMNNPSLGYSKYHHEIESFANTPVRKQTYDEWEESQWQDPYYYELNQSVWTQDPQSGEGGAVGTMVQQGGEVPGVVEHDQEGNVVKETKQLKQSKEERRAARKAAKRARREAYKQEKIQQVRDSKLTDPDAVRRMLETDRRNEEEERMRKREESRKKKAEEEQRESAENDTKEESKEERRARKKEKRKKEDKQKKNGAENDIDDGEADEDEQSRKHKRKKHKKSAENDKDSEHDEDERSKREHKKQKESKKKSKKQVKRESG